MATRTIANAGGNWSATGTWVEGAVPTSADDVVATATSGALTIDAASSCRSIDMTNYVSTLTHNAFTLSVGDASGGALKFVAGMTYTKANNATSATSFVSTSNNGGAGWGITTAGKVLGNLVFNGIGGKWTLQDTLTANAGSAPTCTVTNGEFNSNNQAMNLSNLTSGGAGSGATLTFGSSAIALNTNGTTFFLTGAPTITANTATVTLTAATSQLTNNSGVAINLNGMSVVAQPTQNFSFAGNSALTMANLTVTGGAFAYPGFGIGASATITVTGTLTITGNSSVNRLLVWSSLPGVANTLSAATVTASNVDFADVTAAGAGSWNLSAITGGAGDAGGNTGITFTTATTRYAVAAGNWSSTATWSATSGGAGGASVPLPQDDVNFNASSGAGTYTGDMMRLGKNLNCTGFTGTLNVTTTSFGVPYFFGGSVTLATGMTWSLTQPATLVGRGTHTLTSAGKTFATATLTLGAGVGTYTLQDAFITTARITHSTGGFDTNSQAVTALRLSSNSGRTRSLTLGTSTITLTDTSAVSVWDLGANAGLAFSGASSTIIFSAASASNRTFAGAAFGGGLTYGTLTYTVAASTGSLIISGGNTFDTLNVNGGIRTLSLPTSATTTVTTWNVFGVDASNLVTLNSATPGSTTTQLTKAGGGQVTAQYLSVKDSKATPGSTWFATPGGVDAGNNTGWTFGPIPTFVPPVFRLRGGAVTRASVV